MFTCYPAPPRQNSTARPHVDRSAGSKIPPEMIQHFKNTPEIPKRVANSKENQNPRGLLNLHPDISISKVEGKTQPSTDNNKTIGVVELGAKAAKSRIVE